MNNTQHQNNQSFIRKNIYMDLGKIRLKPLVFLFQILRVSVLGR